MRTAFVASMAASTLATKANIGDVEMMAEYNNFLTQFNKTYSEEEKTIRFPAFVESVLNIQKMSIEFPELSFSLNEHSDRSESEEKMLFSNKQPSIDTHVDRFRNGAPFDPAKEGLPASLDYRSKGCVSPVTNQGSCGSCWAFAGVSLLEGAWCKATGSMRRFSVQNMVDCSVNSRGCSGSGSLSNVLHDMSHLGVCTWTEYPYKGIQGSCRDKTCNVGTMGGINRHVTLFPYSDGEMVKYVDRYGAMGGTVAWEQFKSILKNYSGGYVTREMCLRANDTRYVAPDHAVAVVGWKHEVSTKKTFFLIKNSHGQSWGEKGYLWLELNACGFTHRNIAAAHVHDVREIMARNMRRYNNRFELSSEAHVTANKEEEAEGVLEDPELPTTFVGEVESVRM